MADNEIGYNGNVYILVSDPGPEGEAIKERYAHLKDQYPEQTTTVVCRWNNQPAILVDGELYIKGDTNYVPGSQGIWDRVFGLSNRR